MSGGYFESLVVPLRVPIFRSLWVATVISNIGTLMHGVAAAWLMTSMTTSPLLVGLVPACVFLPTFVAGIWGGVLSDIFERRTILVITQAGMMLCASVMGALTVFGMMSPGVLLGLTFCLGFLNAANLPAWQSQIQEMVPPDHLAAAVSLNSISFNAARSIGPALGGLVVAVAGAATVFFINAVSFLGTIVVLVGWKRPARRKNASAVWQSFRDGISYVARCRALRAPLVRVAAFSFFGSAVWALLPLLARKGLGTGPAGYGAMLAAFGVGSVAIAGFVPGLRRRHHPDRLIGPAIVLLAGVFAVLGLSGYYPAVLVALFAGGLAWVGVLVQFNVAVQFAVPDEYRGRALAFYLMFFQGALGLGSAFHGWLANHIGIGPTFLLAGALLFIGLPLIWFFPLGGSCGPDEHGLYDRISSE